MLVDPVDILIMGLGPQVSVNQEAHVSVRHSRSGLEGFVKDASN